MTFYDSSVKCVDVFRIALMEESKLWFYNVSCG